MPPWPIRAFATAGAQLCRLRTLGACEAEPGRRAAQARILENAACRCTAAGVANDLCAAGFPELQWRDCGASDRAAAAATPAAFRRRTRLYTVHANAGSAGRRIVAPCPAGAFLHWQSGRQSRPSRVARFDRFVRQHPGGTARFGRQSQRARAARTHPLHHAGRLRTPGCAVRKNRGKPEGTARYRA